MDNVTKDYSTIYQREKNYPSGQPLTTHVDPFQINDDVPSDMEVKSAVQIHCSHKAVNHTYLCEEHFRTWLCKAYPGEGVNPPPPSKPGRWIQLLDIFQYISNTGEIPLELGWTIMVLIPKRNIDTQEMLYGDAMEGYGGYHRYPPPGQHPIS